MASVSERLALIIDFKGDTAIKGLDGVARKSETADEKTRGLSDKLTKMGATGLAASGVAAVGLSKLASSASDLNEVTNKAKVLFGDAYGEIDKFASSAAKSIGQSKTAALEAASTFAGLGRAAGLSGGDLAGFSTSLTTLASDLASFGNTSPEEAVQALGSALRGEAEPIRAYNVLLDDAKLKNRALQMGLIETTTGTLPPAIKVQAAYAEIMAQTAAAQGDFGNTSDGLANQQRILKAEIEDLAAGIGTGLLPAFTGIIKGATGVVGKLNELPPAAKSMLGTLAAGGVGVTAAVSGISLIAGQVVKLKERFTDDGGGLNNFGKVAVASAVGVGVFATAIGVVQMRSEKSKQELQGLRAEMARTGKDAGGAASELIAKWVFSHDTAAKALARHKISIETVTAAVRGEGDAIKAIKAARDDDIANGRNKEAQAIINLMGEIEALSDARKTEIKDSEASAKAADATKVKVEGYTGSISEQRKYILDNIDAHEDYTKSVEDEKRVQENAERATKELTKALNDQKQKNDDLYQSFLTAWSGENIDLPKAIDDVRTSLLNYYDASEEAAKATKEHGAASEEAQRAQLKFNEAGRGGYEAIQNYARVALETEAARRGISVDALDASEKVSIQKRALEELKLKVPEYTGAIDEVSKSIDGVANSMDTAAGMTEDASRRITAAVEEMRSRVVAAFNEITLGASGLSIIAVTADQAERTLNGLAAAARTNGADAVTGAAAGRRNP